MRCMLSLGIWSSLTFRLPATSEKPSDAVIELTEADFDSRVQRGHKVPWFVKFYAPWCGHCKKLVPDWERLASDLKDSVHVARVDATRERALAKNWSVESYPTLKLIAEGKVYTYRGPRTADKLGPWARFEHRQEFSDPFPGEEDDDVVSLTEETFEKRIASDMDAAWFVFFFVPTCEHCKSMAGEFQDFATRPGLRERGLRVAKVDSEKEQELSAKWVSVGFPTMKLIVGGKAATYNGDRTADAMEAWVLDILPPPPSLFHRLLNQRIYGVDPLLPIAFVLGVLTALTLWRIYIYLSRAGEVEESKAKKVT